jgi:hypothetical protein
MQEPSAEVLHAFLLTPSQFQILSDLILQIDGLKRDALQHGASEDEIDTLQHRNLVVSTGDHFNISPIGRKLMGSISSLMQP